MARSEVSEKQVKEIIEVSRKRNKEFGITGSLIYHERVFFQLIESPKHNVLRLYENIKKDRRHFDILTIHQGKKVDRDFILWDMALWSDKTG